MGIVAVLCYNHNGTVTTEWQEKLVKRYWINSNSSEVNWFLMHNRHFLVVNNLKFARSNNGYFDRKACKNKGFSAFLFSSWDWYEIQIWASSIYSAFGTLNRNLLKTPYHRAIIFLGVTKMVDGWPSPEGLWPSVYIETWKGIQWKGGRSSCWR